VIDIVNEEEEKEEQTKGKLARRKLEEIEVFNE
jgi:hypothetical protein